MNGLKLGLWGQNGSEKFTKITKGGKDGYQSSLHSLCKKVEERRREVQTSIRLHERSNRSLAPSQRGMSR